LLEETRTRDAQSWEETQVSYSANKAAVVEAQDILQAIWSGSSDFIQLARHANKMLIQAAKIKKITIVNEVFGTFAELALKQLSADDGVLERIKELLRKLSSDLDSEFQEAEEDEQASIAEYNETKERTENSLASLSAQIDSLNAELNELNKCIVVQGGIVQSATAKLERNNKLAEDASAMCQVFVEEYHSAAAGRKEELDLIYVIKQKVEARLGSNH
jgi:chromosome segregation ATPase